MKSPKIYILLALIFLLLSAKAQDVGLVEYSKKMDEKYQVELAKTLKLADSLGIPMRTWSGEKWIQLSHFVRGFPVFIATSNIVAAATTSSSAVWPGGVAGLNLTGTGITLGLWDEARARPDHQEFGGRVDIGDAASSNSGHSTHVAGTMIAGGTDPSAKGMSFMARLKSYDWNNDLSEMAAAAAAVGLQVSNHSYSYLTGWHQYDNVNNGWQWFGDTTLSPTIDYGFGAYNQYAYDWDTVAWLATKYLIVKSSDNNRLEGPTQPLQHYVLGGTGWVLASTVRNRDGGTTGFDCIPYQGNAKNILTVGSVNDIPGGYTNPTQVSLASSSGSGPTDDGRIKPDLVANGVGLYSSYSTSATAYATMSGTSMATPNVSGSIGLLLQHQLNLTGSSTIRSATIKALLIHTADEAGFTDGPDYSFGWGLLNTKKAALLMSENAAKGFNLNIHELTINQGDTVRIPIYTDGSHPLKATIAWTDRPSHKFTAFVNDTTHMLVNDLDMRLISNTDVSNYPWKLKGSTPAAAATKGDNSVDNVENVDAGTPVAQQTWYAQITHKGTLVGAHQDFSLIISGNTNPPASSNWNGTTSNDWYTASNWSDGVPGSSTDIVIPAGKTLYPTISSRASCKNITIKSGATLLDNSLLTITGTATVELFITKYDNENDNMFHFLSSPVASQPIVPLFSDPENNTTDDLYKFDENSYLWINLRGSTVNSINPSFESNFTVGRGYLVAYAADGTKTFTGSLNSGNKSIPVYRTTSDPVKSGWNLVGNPYPSTIDWDAGSGWNKTVVNNAIYITKNGDWATYVDGAGTNGGTRYIGAAQGFFVNAANVGTGTLTMNNNVRVHEASPFLKTTKSGKFVRLEVSGQGYADEAIVRFLPDATAAFDGKYDAVKLFGSNEKSAQIYTLGGIPLTINSLAPETEMVQLGIHANVSGNYSIAATEIRDLSNVTLHDLKTETYTDLNQTAYPFTFVPGENEQRFRLLFGTPSEIRAEKNIVDIYSYHHTIFIHIKDKVKGDILVSNVAGQVLISKAGATGTSEFELTASGIYVVKVFSSMGMFIKKVIIM